MNQPSAPPSDQPRPQVRRRDRDGVAVLRIVGPDGNRLGPELVAALDTALSAALADDAVLGIVLTAARQDFCAGPVDDLPPPGPDRVRLPAVVAALATLCDRIEAAAKPVVAIPHGRVAAGGLALVLACDARIAMPDCLFLCHEPRLGRMPPGGAAVRLAWRIGAGPTLALTGGRRLGADEAEALGLVDAVAENAMALAVERVRALAAGPRVRARPGLDDGAAFAAAVAAARATLPAPLPGHRLPEGWLIDTVEAAALLPPEQALAFDRIRAEDASLRAESRMLAHLARAARRAQEPVPQGAEGPVCVALEPFAAARLVPVLLREGASVILLGPDRERLTETLEGVAEAQFAQVRAGRMTQAEAAADWQRIAGRLRLDPGHPPAAALADAAHLAWLDGLLPEGVPLAAWDPDEGWVEGLTRPDRALAVLPAPTRPVRLCEVVAREDVAVGVTEAVAALALRLRLTPLRVQRGPVLTPLIRAAARAAARLRAAGVPVATLAAIEILPEGLAEGTLGPEIETLPLPAERMVLLAVVNAAMGLLDMGRAIRPSDLDLALVMGAGWPNWRGGPLAEADALGPMVVRHELQAAAGLDPALWTPDPMLDEMIRNGWRFEDLNGG
ncbi:MAG: enoyl-CoA hydratase/isomerase family protein [Rhodobacteraceae bacterium]|nr:enoyl-CoA hydratase/isomerase family protein [Paracoccaceae bacterium]